MLMAGNIPEVPEDVKVLKDFGYTEIVINNNPHDTVSGHHVMVEGEPKAVAKWLHPTDGVWVGVGNPMLEHFEVRHIKDEAVQ
jgi:hypothetical protein